MAQKQNRLDWVQVLRGLAAIMVMFYHLGLFEGKAFGSQLITPAFFKAGESGVDVFFVISGFVMLYITPQKFETIFDFCEFLYRRFTRIFPPYWIISSLLLVVWLRKPDLFNNYYHHQMDIGRSFFLLPQAFTPLTGVGWSLIHEIYFYIVISGLLFFGTMGRVSLLALWCAAVLLANLLVSTIAYSGHPFLQLISSPFSLEFQLGMVVAFSFKSFARLSFPIWLYTISALGGVVALYVSGQFTPFVGVYPDNDHLFRVSYYGLISFFIVLCVVQYNLSPLHVKAPTWGVLLGDASYALYLVHIPIITMLYKIFSAMTPHPNWWLAFCYFWLVILTSIGGGIFFHIKIERRLISFFHKLAIKLFQKATPQ